MLVFGSVDQNTVTMKSPFIADQMNSEPTSAGSVLAGTELMHMIRKDQFAIDGTEAMSFADQFFAPAGIVRPV